MTAVGATIWTLVTLAVATSALAVWVFSHPEIVAKGQDAAGKGMATGCLGFLLFCFVGLLGIVTAVLAVYNRAQLAGPTVIIAWLPVFGLLTALMIGLIASMVARSRAEEEQRQEELKIPVFLLVDGDDARLSPLYNAINQHYPHVQTQIFSSPVALHWQQHWMPRAKLIAIRADPSPAGQDIRREIGELVDDIVYMNPAANVLFHATNPDDAKPYLAKLQNSRLIKTDGDDWITTVWLPAALEMLERYPELKNKPAEEPE